MIKIPEDIKLSNNFYLREFASNDGAFFPTEVIENLEFLVINYLQPLRNIIGSISINSGYRSFSWNKHPSVKGHPKSYHLKGMAADIRWHNKEWSLDEVAKICKGLGLKVIVYSWGIHINYGQQATIIDER